MKLVGNLGDTYLLTFVVTMVIVLVLAGLVLLAVARGAGKELGDLKPGKKSADGGDKSP